MHVKDYSPAPGGFKEKTSLLFISVEINLFSNIKLFIMYATNKVSMKIKFQLYF